MSPVLSFPGRQAVSFVSMPLGMTGSKLGNSLVIQGRASHLLYSHSYRFALCWRAASQQKYNSNYCTKPSRRGMLSFWRFSPSFVMKRIKILTAVLSTIFSLQNFKSVPGREGGTWSLSVEIQCWISCHITANASQLRSAKQNTEHGRVGSRIFLLTTHPEAASQPTKIHLCNPLISLHPGLMI